MRISLGFTQEPELAALTVMCLDALFWFSFCTHACLLNLYQSESQKEADGTCK